MRDLMGVCWRRVSPYLRAADFFLFWGGGSLSRASSVVGRFLGPRRSPDLGGKFRAEENSGREAA